MIQEEHWFAKRKDLEKLYINDNMLFKDKLAQDLHTAFQNYQVIDQKGNTQEIYISTLYIKFHQFQHYIHLKIPIYKKQENLIHDFIQEPSCTKWKANTA